MTSSVTLPLTPVERRGRLSPWENDGDVSGSPKWRMHLDLSREPEQRAWPVPHSLARGTLSPFGRRSLPVAYIHLILGNMRVPGPTATKQLHACIVASLVLPETPVSGKSWQGSRALPYTLGQNVILLVGMKIY